MATKAAQAMFGLIRVRVINDFVLIHKAMDGFEFITSDNPVYFRPKDEGAFPIPLDPTNSLWMPIDNKHLLQLQPWKDQLPTINIGKNERRANTWYDDNNKQ